MRSRCHRSGVSTVNPAGSRRSICFHVYKYIYNYIYVCMIIYVYIYIYIHIMYISICLVYSYVYSSIELQLYCVPLQTCLHVVFMKSNSLIAFVLCPGIPGESWRFCGSSSVPWFLSEVDRSHWDRTLVERTVGARRVPRQNMSKLFKIIKIRAK